MHFAAPAYNSVILKKRGEKEEKKIHDLANIFRV
jgi:hypothetical protein